MILDSARRNRWCERTFWTYKCFGIQSRWKEVCLIDWYNLHLMSFMCLFFLLALFLILWNFDFSVSLVEVKMVTWDCITLTPITSTSRFRSFLKQTSRSGFRSLYLALQVGRIFKFVLHFRLFPLQFFQLQAITNRHYLRIQMSIVFPSVSHTYTVARLDISNTITKTVKISVMDLW